MISAAPHISVMRDEVLQALEPQDGEVHFDGTFGAGGYSAALLAHAVCTVIATDRDETAIPYAQALKKQYGDRFVFIRGRFGDADKHLQGAGCKKIDGFVLDVGVSSMQIDEAERGFSFQKDGPLDMRMDRESGDPTAADIVNEYPEKELADIIYKYGEERHSRRVARAIAERRRERAFTRTGDLADVVRSVVPRSRKDQIDPATRTFQALRVYVNREIEELEKALAAAERVLRAGGRLVVVSFHSLEDGIVKHFLRERSGGAGRGSRHLPDVAGGELPTFSLPSRKAILPSDEEVAINPRARSARMRVAVRTDAPARGHERGRV